MPPLGGVGAHDMIELFGVLEASNAIISIRRLFTDMATLNTCCYRTINNLNVTYTNSKMEMKKLLNCDVPRLLPSPDQSNLNNETIRDIGFTFHPIGKIHMKIFSVPQQESNDKHSMKVYDLGAN